MEKYVIKRTGEYKPLDLFKIKDAIVKGFQSVNQQYEELIFDEVVYELNSIIISILWRIRNKYHMKNFKD